MPILFKACLLKCSDFMFKNQILHRKSGFSASLGKSEDLVMRGLGVHYLVCPSPSEPTQLRLLMHHRVPEEMRPQPEAAGGEGGWGSWGRGCSLHKLQLPQGPPAPRQGGCGCCTHWPPLCAPDCRLYQDGTLKLLGRLSLLSEEILWAANGLPNPFCSSDHLCLLASFGMEVTAP